MEEKLEKSKLKYRQRILELYNNQRQVKLLGDEDKEVMLKGGKRIKVEQHARMVNEIVGKGVKQDTNMDTTSKITKEQSAICTFPKGKGGITLYPADVDRLEGCTFLNDQLINIMLKWALHKHLSEEVKANTFICDTHIFSVLTAKVNWKDTTTLFHLEANVRKVSEWFQKGKEVLRNMVFVPICEGLHWYLAIIINEIDTWNSQVYVMDSMSRDNKEYVGLVLQQLILAVAKEPRTFCQVNMEVRQQENGHDCGVHLIHNATQFMRAASTLQNPAINDIEGFINSTVTTREDLKAIVAELQQQTSYVHTPEITYIAQQPTPTTQPQGTPGILEQQQQTSYIHTPEITYITQQPTPATQPQGTPGISYMSTQHKQTTPQQEIAISSAQNIDSTQSTILLREGEQHEVKPRITLGNKTKADWWVPEEVRKELVKLVEEARKNIELCQQRRRIFVKETEHGKYRVQVAKTNGWGKVYKIDEN